jgi:hypothetical protein
MAARLKVGMYSADDMETSATKSTESPVKSYLAAQFVPSVAESVVGLRVKAICRKEDEYGNRVPSDYLEMVAARS